MYPHPIVWRLHLVSPIKKVYDAIAPDEGRQMFWVESSHRDGDNVLLKFINGVEYQAKIIAEDEPSRFEIIYFDSRVVFGLAENEKGGTDLTVTDAGVSKEEYESIYAGWLSVLFALKGYVDFGIDLRNHDPKRTWDQGFVEN